MKTSDVKDTTIRSVGDVKSISTGDVAKSGVSSGPAGAVSAPESSGNPTGDGGALKTLDMPYNPSMDGLPAPDGRSGYPAAQPMMGSTPEADSVQTTPTGRSVTWPDAADKSGGVKSTTTLCEKTGAKVSFPPASNTKGPIKDVTTFGK